MKSIEMVSVHVLYYYSLLRNCVINWSIDLWNKLPLCRNRKSIRTCTWHAKGLSKFHALWIANTNVMLTLPVPPPPGPPAAGPPPGQNLPGEDVHENAGAEAPQPSAPDASKMDYVMNPF